MNMDGGIGSGVHVKVVAVVLGTGDQSEEEVAVLGSHDGEEVVYWRSNRGGVVQLPRDERVVILERGYFREEDLTLRVLKVRVRGGVRISKERGVPRSFETFACCQN